MRSTASRSVVSDQSTDSIRSGNKAYTRGATGVFGFEDVVLNNLTFSRGHRLTGSPCMASSSQRLRRMKSVGIACPKQGQRLLISRLGGSGASGASGAFGGP